MANEVVRRQNIRHVLQEATRLFVANGIENTSVEMIARASGLTLRSVQNYFRTRNDLYAAVLERGYALELEALESFFGSERYRGESGAEQVIDIIAATLNESIEQAELVFCTAQMQHVLSRVSGDGESPRLAGNWPYVMEQLQGAFARGLRDGSIKQTTESELINEKTILLALLGVREQAAYAMCSKTLCQLLDPQTAVQKYIRQMEWLLKPGGDRR